MLNVPIQTVNRHWDFLVTLERLGLAKTPVTALDCWRNVMRPDLQELTHQSDFLVAIVEGKKNIPVRRPISVFGFAFLHSADFV
jgi:hypothetical protein